MRIAFILQVVGLLACAGLTGFTGCAAAAVAGANDAIGYTITNVAYRTFTASMTQVHAAARQSLAKMQIKMIADEKSEDGFVLRGQAGPLSIEISLTTITPKVTKASVNAKKKLVIKDRAVAVEILTQMALVLGTR